MPVNEVRSLSTNPLKSSQPLGAAYAFLGIEGAMPLLHGSQGCTAFALVLFVRHFKETIPIQTTAMNEVSTVLGGADHLEEAILNIRTRANPRLIGVCTTALVETRGEDFAADLASITSRRADVLGDCRIVLAETPDFRGSIEEGWSAAVTATIEALTRQTTRRDPERLVVLAPSHFTVGDIETLRQTVETFGLTPVILPDISGSLDGTVPDRWIPSTYGGTPVADIEALGAACHCVAIGEHMRRPAEALRRKTGLAYTLLPTLTGLAAADRLVTLLARLSGRPVPAAIRRRRSQLQDAMLDGHFHFGGRRIAVAAEPDLLYQMAAFFADMGAETTVAIASTPDSPILEAVPAEVTVGDLGDLEERAAGVDLLVSHAHGRQASERLGIPLFRVGFPIFDRLGAQHRRSTLYEGTRDLIFEVANTLIAADHHHPTPESLDPLRNRETLHDSRPSPEPRRH
ncbi:Nitrogenase iron-molybdenum cofactor biosynthesis protein NifN [uncultured Pleomorphomonas sp.]|uniref:Nitrogenase iron-molybdenum cofactor biosynthesis protein NifN n=1 Tax=uncultured Pleomorphomonas sp. TaxID=442121 RepID=A0A212LHY6_9HYPH|nr:nitrogenase iron-molybdenum cofactor biosynthesis protein NifN [uncultured Pleomorphomonas sp.]SCM77155.1 Nitrogenase iron-molybdenum cofactor biosynthesis protein NifN [uncultured Pleomorphomonas sp.]